MWVDFRQVKEAVQMPALLEHLGVQALKVNGVKARGTCPLCEHKASFTVDLGRKAWSCHACNAEGNALDLVARVYGVSIREAAIELAEMFNVQAEPPAKVPVKAAAKTSEASPAPVAKVEPATEKVGYIRALDGWLDEVLNPTEPIADWKKKTKNAVKAKLIESYRNGQNNRAA